MILLIGIIANKETRVNTKVIKRNIPISDMCSLHWLKSKRAKFASHSV